MYTDPAMRGPPRGIDAEAVLDHAELHALEPRRRHEKVAEVEEVERRHRLQDVDLVEQQPLDLGHPMQVADRPQHVAIGHDPGEDVEDGVELVEDLLEPQLVRLVDDDEQQLVVGLAAVLAAHRLLARQQAIELQVVVVVQRLPGVAHHRRYGCQMLAAAAVSRPARSGCGGCACPCSRPW